MKSIYTMYKERLIEISGKNRSLYLKNFNKKNGYDIGNILYEDPEKANNLIELLWNGKCTPFKLISKETKDSILKSSDIDSKYPLTQTFNTEKQQAQFERQRTAYAKRIIAQEVRNIKALKREIEEIEKETGRYELFLCYPFVFGSVKNMTFKAPLLFFPISIDPVDDYNVNITLKYGENVQINKALIFAIADANHINTEDIETEFECLKSKFQDIQSILDYLRKFGVKISYQPRKNMFPYDRYDEPIIGDSMEVKSLCLLSRQSLANSIYNDYSLLEKKHLTNNSINELLNTRPTKLKKSKHTDLYLINNVDYAQQQVVRKVNDSGNMVIYGPPGTGKSQTIVNVISDAICKGKKVLVVSQKKAALEVIFNRLSTLNSKTMFIVDSEKEKRAFYTRCYQTHENIMNTPFNDKLIKEYEDEKKRQDLEIQNLKTISSCLTDKTPFGISLQEMYSNSFKIGKKTIEYDIYQDMIKDQVLMELNYEQLVSALSLLKEKNKAELYYNFVLNKKKNPFIDHLNGNLSVHIVAETQSKLRNLCAKRQPLFDTAKYKYTRNVLTYYDQFKSTSNMKPLINMLYKFRNKNQKITKKQIEQDIDITLNAIDEYIKEYDFLKNVLSNDGYIMAIDGIVNGNTSILRLLLSAMENYIELRDTNSTLNSLDDPQKIVLKFAYTNSNTYLKYITTLKKILPIRIYHEIVKYEAEQKSKLSTIVDFENIRSRIVSCKKNLNDISRAIAEQSFNEDYKKIINGSIESKDYIYQISKKQNFWPIRKTMEVYGDYLFKLFPCWLLSPENVSTLLPLVKNMFDVVLFDEASQVFIENTIPSIYRGSTIVVAGDAKQLRPTTTFMRRYMGANVDDDIDYSTQAALEVESLLDLAVSRFNSANITYHYRSQNEELIDFSNKAFYDSTLQIAPNISKNIKNKPIERILVNGTWHTGKNEIEAEKVVELLKTLLKTRKNNETIGIITFNAEQETYIEELIDNKCIHDDEFRKLYLAETSRIENGEDVSLFVKNLENVQGDERDIIIFSIGYARNEFGKVNSIFGTLSNEGGENRLNVAITRSKKKIYVVTSIEPEELKVDQAKFLGPKLLRNYLTYARAVSNRNFEEISAILHSFDNIDLLPKTIGDMPPIEQQIANKLTKLGYTTETNLGQSNIKISVAIYDKKHDKYLLGIETDSTVINSSNSALERDVFRNEFLKSKGWKIYRVWSRDWWHNSSQVISSIVKEIEKQKKLLEKQSNKTIK